MQRAEEDGLSASSGIPFLSLNSTLALTGRDRCRQPLGSTW